MALNALFLDPGVSGGSETYVRQLVPALASEYPETRFSLITTRRGARALRDASWDDFLELIALPTDDDQPLRRTALEQLILPALGRRRGSQVIHSLSNRGPVAFGGASVVTVFDVIPFRHQTLGALSSFGMRQATARAARRATAVITLTHAAAGQIREVLDLDPQRLTVVPPGVAEPPKATTISRKEIDDRHRLSGARVVLCVGALRPHKNQQLLVRALAHLPDDVHVVCAGGGTCAQRLRELATDAGVAGRFHLPGYVPDEELDALWRRASSAAQPTLAEGFGMPVTEAMRRGVPVACSDVPVLREVAGPAAAYFPPNDPVAAAEAISATMDNRQLGEAGREWIEPLTWSAAARATYSVYERAARTVAR